MGDRIRRVDYCYVEVPDGHGDAARVLAALRDHGVSLLSMTASPRSAGTAQIGLVAGKGDLEKGAANTAASAACAQTAFGMILWVKPADVEAAGKALGI